MIPTRVACCVNTLLACSLMCLLSKAAIDSELSSRWISLSPELYFQGQPLKIKGNRSVVSLSRLYNFHCSSQFFDAFSNHNNIGPSIQLGLSRQCSSSILRNHFKHPGSGTTADLCFSTGRPDADVLHLPTLDIADYVNFSTVVSLFKAAII